MALKAGYAVPYSSEKKRSQIVVLVNEDSSITCFDSEINILWQSAIFAKQHQHTIIDKFRVDEVGISILPISLEAQSSGVVVVGLSMVQRNDEEHFEIEEGIDAHEEGDKEHPEMRAKPHLTHFNIVAFNAADGGVIWRHDGFESRNLRDTKSLPRFVQRMSKRDLLTREHHAPGIPDWTVFRDSLLAELPHDWHSGLDTSLRIAHFERRHIGAGAVHQADRPKDFRSSEKKRMGSSLSRGKFTGLETPALSKSATLPHDAAEHLELPNVIGKMINEQLFKCNLCSSFA